MHCTALRAERLDYLLSNGLLIVGKSVSVLLSHSPSPLSSPPLPPLRCPASVSMSEIDLRDALARDLSINHPRLLAITRHVAAIRFYTMLGRVEAMAATRGRHRLLRGGGHERGWERDSAANHQSIVVL